MTIFSWGWGRGRKPESTVASLETKEQPWVSLEKNAEEVAAAWRTSELERAEFLNSRHMGLAK